MGQRFVYAALAAIACTTAHAEHAIDIEPGYQPAYQPTAVSEVCSTTDFGYGEIRTDCRTSPIAPAKADPALKGICTIYYGRRTCY